MRTIILGFISFYREVISPLTPKSCRYLPTCSEYGYEAIQKHGIMKGGWLLLKRLVRCHPFCKGGFDPVP
ncbi:MAG: membrane protein insertion efficiency factor YidD [Chloroflexi bacterium]|nr:MAG: membrane protein insertion efficiency factor YidD [Chloroflexota bacterium]